jgi:photosystem II stability/assembly factor-like uncharacterized protein
MRIKITLLMAIAITTFLLFYASRPTPIKIDLAENETVEMPKAEWFEHYYDEEFKLLRSSRTGIIPPQIGEQQAALSMQMMQEARLRRNVDDATYSFEGPNNLAGRMRAICFDKNDATGNTLMVGSVSGGLFSSTNGGANWTRIEIPGKLQYTITAIAQDPRIGFGNIWYCGGGETFGASQGEAGVGHYGDGIYKSTNNGVSWSKLSNSNTGLYYQYDRSTDKVNNIVVHPTNGDVYVGAANAVMRSTDGGNSWQEVLGSFASYSFSITEVIINSAGKIYAAFNTYNDPSVKGIWTSNTGALNSWTKLIAPSSIDVDNATCIRMSLATNKTDILVIDAIYTSGCNGEAQLFKIISSNNSFQSLSVPNCGGGPPRFSAQGGYNLCVLAHPTNPNILFIGGVNLYRSIDGGTTWSGIGGDIGFTGIDTHADLHDLRFSPSNNSFLYCVDDGGVRKGNIDNPIVTWLPLNDNIPSFQYYHVAINPTAGVNHFIGGTQDNGTSRALNSSGNHERIYGGDGTSVCISSNGTAPYKEFFGSQNGIVIRKNTGQPYSDYEVQLTPTVGVQGSFITDFFLDPDNGEYMYYTGYVNGAFGCKLLRLTNASSTFSPNWETFDFLFGSYIRAFATTRGPYNAATSKLYVGDELGKLYRINNPVNAALNTVPVNITPPGVGLNVCIGVSVNPTNDNEVLAVFSNYDAPSIWHTLNGGDANPTWVNVEGNLDLPSIRACEIIKIGTRKEFVVGTSIGLFKTDLLNGTNTVWQQQSPDIIGNALVRDLAYRPIDNTLLIGTHGSGMYKAVFSNVTLPVSLLDFSGTLQNGETMLNWQTAQEQNNSGFTIQYATNAIDFVDIGFVAAKGNSSTTNAYRFQHKNVIAPKNYYRLKQMDKDGKFQLSKIVQLEQSFGNQVQIMNNPTKGAIKAFITTTSNLPVQFQLVNMSGQMLMHKKLTEGNVQIDVQGLPAGTYNSLWKWSNGEIISKKIIIL